MKVKICGITRKDDALTAVRAGADAIGFIFVRSSKRWIEPASARAIVAELPSHVTPVGVFVNASRAEIGRAIDTAAIRLLQLHGDETPEEVSGFDLPVWKAFRVGTEFNVGSLAKFQADGFLLDAFVEGMNGGTGRRFNWEIAVAAKIYGPVILSGGITPENVGKAIREVSPYAVDVSSGVESSPGIKDAAKIARLFEAIRQSKESLC